MTKHVAGSVAGLTIEYAFATAVMRLPLTVASGSEDWQEMWWKTYPDGEVEGQPNTSEIGGRERQSLLRQ